MILEYITEAIMLVAIVANLTLGAVVYRGRASRPVRLSFIVMMISFSLWTASNMGYQLAQGGIEYSFALLAYTSASWMALSFFWFVDIYTNWRKKYLFFIYVPGLLVSFTFLIPNFIATGVQDGAIITTNWLYLFAAFIVPIVALPVLRLATIWWKNRDKSSRYEIGGIFFAFLATAILALIFNLLLPMVGVYSAVSLGPISTMVFVVLCTRTIIKRGLLGSQFIIVRAIAYAVLFIVILLIWLGITIITKGVIKDFVITEIEMAIEAFTVVVIVAILQPTRRRVDKLIDKLFYIRHYDINQLTSDISLLAIKDVELIGLLDDSAKLIRETLGAGYVTFVLLDQKGQMSITQTTLNNPIPVSFIEQAEKYFSRRRAKMVYVDDIDYRNPLYDICVDNEIGVVSRIDLEQPGRETLVSGYILIGERDRGVGYGRTDLTTISVLSDLMAIAIQNSLYYQQIEQFNTELSEKIEKSTASLRAANKRLRVLDEAKDEFLSMASHQLRTPLTSVHGYVEMLLDGDFGKLNDRQMRAAYEINSSAMRMISLVRDFLNVSRIQAGNFSLEIEKINITEELDDIIHRLQSLAHTKNVKLVYDKGKTTMAAEAEADRERISAAMSNLIDNAIFYSPPGGKVEVSLTKEGKFLEFLVVDHGIGIPEEDHQNIFTKFYRATNARTVRPDGTGIGLFLARTIVEEHNGEFIFESELQKGSKFGFRLPTVFGFRIPIENEKVDNK
jgi:signal transduction histidine kinase